MAQDNIMNRPFLAISIAFCLMLAIIAPANAAFSKYSPDGLSASTLLASPATADQPVAITETGFDPVTVTIQAGDSVTWTNQTPDPVGLAAGIIYKIYLPHIKKSNPAIFAPVVPLAPAPSIEDTIILPGASFTSEFEGVGTFPFYISGDMEHTGVVIVTPMKDFTILADPDNGSAYAGRPVSYTIHTTPINGFDAPVTLDVSGLPGGVSPAWGANPVTPPASSLLTINTANDSVSGTAGDLTHSIPVSLTVRAWPDLETQSIILDPGLLIPDTAAILTARINNLGPGDADAFTVTWQVFPLGQTTPVAGGSWQVAGLLAGTHQDLTTTIIISNRRLHRPGGG
jgi:hypothetical protein